MSDDELDREWKPNGRPQSSVTISRAADPADLIETGPWPALSLLH
jgi:hypothetical protein